MGWGFSRPPLSGSIYLWSCSWLLSRRLLYILIRSRKLEGVVWLYGSCHCAGIFHVPCWHRREHGPWKTLMDSWMAGCKNKQTRAESGEGGMLDGVEFNILNLMGLKYYLHKFWIHLQVSPPYSAGPDLLNLEFGCSQQEWLGSETSAKIMCLHHVQSVHLVKHCLCYLLCPPTVSSSCVLCIHHMVLSDTEHLLITHSVIN